MPSQIPQKTVSEKISRSFAKFTEVEASGGILLLGCTLIALFWANSPWAPVYNALWETKFTLGIGSAVLSKPLLLWINDGLMAVFFFVVGLEIKREILIGELASLKRAALPVLAALGGMLIPAGIYFFFNKGTPSAPGWGIPMATDIAFALGVLTLLGKRVPVSLKIFLMALAIIDDLGAVLVIAFFYTSHISWLNLGIGAVFLSLLFLANLSGARHPLVYAVLGIGGLWLAFLLSGVHATIAGVLAAFMIPASTRINTQQFLETSKRLVQDFQKHSSLGKDVLTNQDQQFALYNLEKNCELVQTPLQRLEHGLHPWVHYLIMPIFALANAGVSLQEGNFFQTLAHPITFGIFVGLLLGKPLGITSFSWIAVKLKWAVLPSGVSWKQIIGVGILGGIGFTMSLFIAGLAFEEPVQLSAAKIAILLTSSVAGAVGWIFLRSVKAKK